MQGQTQQHVSTQVRSAVLHSSLTFQASSCQLTWRWDRVVNKEASQHAQLRFFRGLPA